MLLFCFGCWEKNTLQRVDASSWIVVRTDASRLMLTMGVVRFSVYVHLSWTAVLQRPTQTPGQLLVAQVTILRGGKVECIVSHTQGRMQ